MWDTFRELDFGVALVVDGTVGELLRHCKASVGIRFSAFCFLRNRFKSSKMLWIHRAKNGWIPFGFQSWSVDLEKIPKLVSRSSFRGSSHIVQPRDDRPSQAMPRRSWTRCALCASIPLKGETGRCFGDVGRVAGCCGIANQKYSRHVRDLE